MPDTHNPDVYRDCLWSPRASGYRSIRTTVFDDVQRPFELRVRKRARRDRAVGVDAEGSCPTPLEIRRVLTRSLPSPARRVGQPVMPASIQRAIVEMAAVRVSGDRGLARLVATALAEAGHEGAVRIEVDEGALLHSLETLAGPPRIAVLRVAATGVAEVHASKERARVALVAACTAAEEIGADHLAWRCVIAAS